ncbi:MAG: HEPN domain-containing protein [Thermotogota bacterium]|nr:HEPN domain-containing protein [Thermotogota bacterium]
MNKAIQQFRSNIERVHNLGGLYVALVRLTTPAVDATDILRTQIVLTVSALDHYVHEITRLGMVEVFDGLRPPTNAFRRFQVSIDSAMTGLESTGDSSWFEQEIREKHSFHAFQYPDRIADAIRLFSPCELWPSVASNFGLSVQDVKSRLQLIVERRNKIAHEADLDPSYPGTCWPISHSDAENATKFIERLCEQIHSLVI